MTRRWKIRRGHLFALGIGVWLVYRPDEDVPCASYFLWENAITHVDYSFQDEGGA